jgi:hypothetical protein
MKARKDTEESRQSVCNTVLEAVWRADRVRRCASVEVTKPCTNEDHCQPAVAQNAQEQAVGFPASCRLSMMWPGEGRRPGHLQALRQGNQERDPSQSEARCTGVSAGEAAKKNATNSSTWGNPKGFSDTPVLTHGDSAVLGLLRIPRSYSTPNKAHPSPPPPSPVSSARPFRERCIWVVFVSAGW